MITFEQFLAEIETTFQNYADTNDLDNISIKGWVIDKLREFGKNICDTREGVVVVENSRALLSENFKSLIKAFKLNIVNEEDCKKENSHKRTLFKQYITNDVVWDTFTQEYVKDNCNSQLIEEYLVNNTRPMEDFLQVEQLSLIKGMKKDTLDIDCYNLHPSIRDSYPNKISITNRTLNTNFKKGLVYLQYNSLPCDEDGEIVIPIITTGDIYKFITLDIKIRIAESLIMNDKNPKGLQNLLPMWLQQQRLLEVKARSEANWYGLNPNWGNKMYKNKIDTLNRYNLPK